MMEEKKLKECLDKVLADHRSFLLNAVQEEKFLEEEEASLVSQIHSVKRSINSLTKKNNEIQKKYNRNLDMNERLQLDLEALSQRLYKYQSEIDTKEDMVRREIMHVKSQLRDMNNAQSNLKESQEIIANNILVTNTVIAELESDHKLAIQNFNSIASDAFNAFKRWSTLFPIMHLHLKHDNESIKTLHSAAQIAGKLEECTKLKQLAAEIQQFSNVDFRMLEDTSGIPHNYFWDDLLGQFRYHTDNAVSEAAGVITDIEELERTRATLKSLSQELCTSLDAFVQMSMVDAELKTVSIDPEGMNNENGEPITVIPVSNSESRERTSTPPRKGRPEFDLLGLQHISERLSIGSANGLSNASPKPRKFTKAAQALAEAHFKNRQHKQAALRRLLDDWIASTDIAVGDIAMYWCKNAITETDPINVSSLVSEFPGDQRVSDSHRNQFPNRSLLNRAVDQRTRIDDVWNHAIEFKSDALSSGNIVTIAAECRRISRELQFSIASSLTSFHQGAPGLTSIPNLTAIFRDWAYMSNLLQFSSHVINSNPTYVPIQLKEIVESLSVGSNVGEINEQEDEGDDKFPSTPQQHVNRHHGSENRHMPRFTISERISGNYAEVLKLFPASDDHAHHSHGSHRSDSHSPARGGAVRVIHGHGDEGSAAYTEGSIMSEGMDYSSPHSSPTSRPTVIDHHSFLQLEKKDLEEIDDSQRLVLHLTCRISSDLLNISITWQPQLERLKLTAHCLQMSGKAVYNILLTPLDVEQILAGSDDVHLRIMKVDNVSVCKAVIASMRVEHFPPAIAIGLVRKSRSLQTRAQLACVPVVTNCMFDDTIKLITFRTAKGVLITCCLDVDAYLKLH